MKLHSIKNTLSAKTQPERDGWFVAIEEASKMATLRKEEMIASPGYKETMDKLGRSTHTHTSRKILKSRKHPLFRVSVLT